MNRYARWLLFAGILAVTGCSGSSKSTPDAGPCGAPCGSGQGCDPSTKTCAPGLAEGQPCGVDAATDGGATICVDGLSCGIVGSGKHLCSRDCTHNSDCSNGETCLTSTVGSETRTYCATAVHVGEACNIGSLRQCTPSSSGQLVTCVEPTNGADGLCMQQCDSNVPCPNGQACSTDFGNSTGVCVAPTQPNDPCNQDEFKFCTTPQVCVVVSGTHGFCHVSCNSAQTDAGCAAGLDCITADPCAAPGPGFCVTPNANCDATQNQFCGKGFDCVNYGGLVCRQDCSQGQACTESSTTCHTLPNCHKACF